MKTSWLIAPGITLHDRQIASAVIRAIPKIRQAHARLYGYLRFDGWRWNLRLLSRPAFAGKGYIVILRGAPATRIVRTLVARCDFAEQQRAAKRLVGYVPGNRHNYLLELCQACKEAGYTRLQARFKIELWAQRHGDEDRSYIVDLVYPETAGERIRRFIVGHSGRKQHANL